MPYKSDKQRKFFKACENNPESMDAKCPPKSVLRDFSGKGILAHKRKEKSK